MHFWLNFNEKQYVILCNYSIYFNALLGTEILSIISIMHFKYIEFLKFQ